MTFVLELVRSVFRIVFLRGSPERIYYTRRLFIVCLALAVLASASVQVFYFGDHLVFVILRVFAELTMFMLMMTLLTARIPRFRLARMMLVLVLISLMTDVLLVLISPAVAAALLTPPASQYLAYVLGGIAMYGAASVVAWGLSKPLVRGAAVIGMYVAAVVGLDMAFRHLYQIMAGL